MSFWEDSLNIHRVVGGEDTGGIKGILLPHRCHFSDHFPDLHRQSQDNGDRDSPDKRIIVNPETENLPSLCDTVTNFGRHISF